MVERSSCPTGHYSELLAAQFRRRLAGYCRKRSVYIGVTSDPETRERQHQKDGWERMILLWQTDSYSKAREAEKNLIAWARDKEKPVCNIKQGGGRLSEYAKQRYYLYLMI